MHNKTSISIWIIMLGITLSAQSQTDSIEVRKGLGTYFIQNDRKLTARQLLSITESNAKAYQEMKKAKSNMDVGTVFGFAGGFLVGFPLGTALAGGEPNWTLAAIGAGLIVVSIPFSTAYTKHAKNAVRIYNEGLTQTGYNRVDIKVGITCNGMMGIIMKF